MLHRNVDALRSRVPKRSSPAVRPLVAAAALTLAACSASPTANSVQADVNAAALRAQGDIDTYAANRLADRPSPPVAVHATPAATPTVVPASPEPDAAAGEAADAARTYFALLEAGNYRRAFRLWADDGRASGLTERRFVAGFERYADYRAEVGVPGRVEPGAGQRHVEVPVRIAGTPADGGRPIVLTGTVTLRRTVVDGADGEAGAWRIAAAALRPDQRRPAAAADGRVRPTCPDEARPGPRGDALGSPGGVPADDAPSTRGERRSDGRSASAVRPACPAAD